MAYTCNTQAHGLSLEYITGKPAGFTGQYIVLDNKLLLGDRQIGKPLVYYKRTMYYPFFDHLLSELDSCSVKPSPLFTITLSLDYNKSRKM